MLLYPKLYNAPSLVISAVPLMFFTFKLVKVFSLYTGQVRTHISTALAATMAGMALTYVVGRASLSGLFRGKPIAFLRTPKMAARVPLLKALFAARDETVLAMALMVCIGLVAWQLGFESQENLWWCAVLVTQCLPMLAATLVAVLSGLPQSAQQQ